MKKQKFTYRMLALAMSLCMIFTMMPMAAHATTHEHDASCGYAPASECNHTHDGTCGYAEAVAGAACNHTHGDCSYVAASDGTPCNHDCDFDVCGYVPAVPGTPCDKGCSEIVDGEIQHNNCDYSEGEPEWPCTHSHDASCGYVRPTNGTACDHQHDANCGYTEASEAQPCTHEHDGTCGYSEGSECTYVETPVDETEHTHIWADGWTSNITDHWHECIADGCDLPAGEEHPDKKGYNEHTYDSNYICTACSHACSHNGHEENYDQDSAGHWEVCPFLCGFTTAVQPHDQNGENGSCSVCYYDPNSSTDPDEHTHEWGGWEPNGDGTHTRTCANDASHTETEKCSGGAATCKDKAVCSVCAAAYGELANHTYKDGKCTVCEAEDPNYKPTATPQTGDNSHIALWITLLFISGGAAMVLIVSERKKRISNT